MKLKQLLIYFILSSCSIYCSQLTLGIPYSKKVTIWRYWNNINEELKEEVLILNEDSVTTKISIWLAKIATVGLHPTAVIDSSFGVLGNWKLAAHNYVVEEFPKMELNNHYQYVLAVYKNDSVHCGYLTVSIPKPFGINQAERINTTQGINGLGGNCNFCQWEHSSLFLKSGQKENIILRLKKEEKPVCSDSSYTVLFPINNDNNQNTIELQNIKADYLNTDSTSSESFPYENIKGSLFTIPKETSLTEFIIEVEIEAPNVNFPQMMYSSVNTYTSCRISSFHLAVIILPK